MPFDPDASMLSEPSLEALSFALRNPDFWPEVNEGRFEWDYSNCENCAMGLSAAIWNFELPDADEEDVYGYIAEKFRMPRHAAMEIFNTRGVDYDRYRTVTPDIVAVWIDDYLCSRSTFNPGRDVCPAPVRLAIQEVA